MAPTTPPLATPTPDAPGPAAGAWAGIWSGLGQGERIAFGGAAVLLVVGQWLLADLFDRGGVPIAIEIAAAEMLLLILVRAVRPATMWPLPYAVLMAAIGTVIVVPTISDILVALRNFGSIEIGTLLALLVDWLAGLAVGIGAWRVWQAEAT